MSRFNLGMDLNTITMKAGEDERESLAVALRAVAAAGGVELNYDDLCAALGVSVTAVATRLEPTPGWWTTYGRDLFVEPAAALFGISLRNLHPPDVGIELLTADEYAQHFEASYTPLIRRAVENGEPVLAWQGWEDMSWPFWGVITGADESGLIGTTLGWESNRVRLAGVALQCYVIERCEPGQPRRGDLFEMAVHHADVYMNRAPLSPVGPEPPIIVTGPSAMDRWEHWLVSEDVTPEVWNDHCYHAACISAARESAARFLLSCRQVAGADGAELVNDAMAHCQALAAQLTDSCDADGVQKKFATPGGREELRRSVQLAEAEDRRLALCIERLAGG